jgi:hypothetical protein
LSQTAFFIGYDFLRPGGSGSNPRPIWFYQLCFNHWAKCTPHTLYT